MARRVNIHTSLLSCWQRGADAACASTALVAAAEALPEPQRSAGGRGVLVGLPYGEQAHVTADPGGEFLDHPQSGPFRFPRREAGPFPRTFDAKLVA